MNLSEVNWTNSIKNSKKCIILDVRTPNEFEEGHIEKSINLDFYNAEYLNF